MSNVLETATRYGAVTKSDSTVLSFKALYIGGTGDVAVRGEGTDTNTTFESVPAGTILPVKGCRVLAATTATKIVWMDW